MKDFLKIWISEKEIFFLFHLKSPETMFYSQGEFVESDKILRFILGRFAKRGNTLLFIS